LGLLFLLVGIAKLIGGLPVDALFESWGYPGAFRFVVGAVEMLGGVGLMIPMVTHRAAFVLIGVMTGAFFTHLFNAEFGRLPINVAFALVLFGVARSRRRPNTSPAEASTTEALG